MEQIFELKGYPINVQFEEHVLHITNDGSLRQFVATDVTAHTELLVQHMCVAYEHLYGKPLAIDPDSVAVEIWGHIYFGRMGAVLENLTRLTLVEKIADVIVSACAVIDCGEKGHDHNRWCWDMLAPFKERIAGWLSSNEEPETTGS